jgi:hypothetical protein
VLDRIKGGEPYIWKEDQAVFACSVRPGNNEKKDVNTLEVPKDRNDKVMKAVNVPEAPKDKNDTESSATLSGAKPFYKSMGVIVSVLVIIAGLTLFSIKSVRR